MLKKVLMIAGFLGGLSGCTAGSLGSDWVYQEGRDEISQKPFSMALMLLPSSDFTDEPSSLAAYCGEDGLDFSILSEGFWGQDSRYFRKNQTFEMRIGNTLFEGRYLPSSDGESAFLLSDKPPFSAVDRATLIQAFSEPGSVAVRVADYRGVTSTSSRSISGASENLVRVFAMCGR